MFHTHILCLKNCADGRIAGSSSTLILLELMKTRQTVSFDLWMLTCLYQYSTTTYRASDVCLPFLSVFWELIMAENKFVQRITLGKFPPVTLYDKFTSLHFLIRCAFCWYYYSSHFEISRWYVFSFDDPVSTSCKSIEFFLRLNGFFRKSLRPLLAKFQAFGGEIECVRKEGWSCYQSSKLIT